MNRIECKNTFEDCEKKLMDAITRQGMVIFSVIDHGKNAQDVGLKLEKTKLFIFGNPNAWHIINAEE